MIKKAFLFVLFLLATLYKGVVYIIGLISFKNLLTAVKFIFILIFFILKLTYVIFSSYVACLLILAGFLLLGLVQYLPIILKYLYENLPQFVDYLHVSYLVDNTAYKICLYAFIPLHISIMNSIYYTFIDLALRILECLIIIVPLLVSVAYFTLAERKIIASIQRRRGPNVIGYYGLLQPLADGLKLFVKESICPSNANVPLFYLAPILTFYLSLIGWAVIPFGPHSVLADIDCGLLYIFSVSSLGVYGIILSGWASNSKYAFLGCLRSAAQIVSYEVSIGFIFASIILCTGSTNLCDIVYAQENTWFVFPHLPLCLIFMICALAETNRHPFDLPEAEAELVSGYNVEYSSIAFALFFLGEYANILLISSFCVILFFGGWFPFFNISFIHPSVWFGFKVSCIVVFFIISRAVLPRYRYDQLIHLGWKAFLPLSLAWFVFTFGVLLSLNALPV